MESPITSGSPSPQKSTNAYRWWVVGMLWMVCFFNYADRQALSAVTKPIQEEFHFSESELGVIGSAFMWVYALGAPFAGFICDRFRRKNLILGGCLFWSAVTVMTGWCSRWWHFVTVRALEGFGETFYFPASMSLVSDYHSAKTRSKAMAIHQSSVYAGTILGSVLGAWFAVNHGWRSGFYVFGAAGCILAVILFGFLKEPPRGASEPNSLGHAPTSDVWSMEAVKRAIQDVFGSRTAFILMGVFAGANAVAAVFLFWAPKFLAEKFHFQLTMAGLSGTAFINIASAISVPFAGIAADYWAQRRVGGRLWVQAFGLLGGAALVSVVGLTEDRGILMVSMVGVGLFKGCYDAGIFASLYDVVPARSRATAAGLMNTIGWGGGATGTALAGWYADHGSYSSKVENMSHFIAWGGAVYVLGGVLLVTAIALFARRDIQRLEKAHSQNLVS